MPNTNRALIIIGSNANIVNDIIVEIETSNCFEKITLISTSKAPTRQNKLYEEISCTNDVLNKKIVKSIKAGRMTSLFPIHIV